MQVPICDWQALEGQFSPKQTEDKIYYRGRSYCCCDCSHFCKFTAIVSVVILSCFTSASYLAYLAAMSNDNKSRAGEIMGAVISGLAGCYCFISLACVLVTVDDGDEEELRARH